MSKGEISHFYAMAVIFNFVWEMTAGLLYTAMHWLECLIASLLDGIMVLAIVAIGAAVFKDIHWFKSPGLRGILLTTGAGFSMACLTEGLGRYWLKLWDYSNAMPMIFGVGLLPVLQMSVLPLLIFAAHKQLSRLLLKY